MGRIHLLPLFRICVAWVLGITLKGPSSTEFLWMVWAGAAICLLCLLGTALVQVPPGHVVWKARVFFAFGFFFLASYLNTHYANPFAHSGHYANQPQASHLEVVVDEWPAEYKTGSFKSKGRVRASLVHGTWQAASGQVLLYFLDHPLPGKSKIIGCPLVFATTSLAQMNSPTNPGQFDYAGLMRLEGIKDQVFLRRSDYAVDTLHRVKNWHYSLQAWRQQLLVNLSFLRGNTLGVAEALLLGYKENLDGETRDAFSRTGTMHVLAVSGLHVGIVYMVLAWVLQIILGANRNRLLKLVITVGVLWAYAIVTGMPPSVQRAAFMFSLLAVGEQLNRPYNVYNSLLLSAFVLLCIQPTLIYQLGFQLSYLAVLGIVAFQPQIQGLFNPENVVLKYAWGLVAVSFAAQISTFPLTIYHFGQFPIIFPLANLIAIPGAFAVVVFGMVLMLASAVGGQVLWLAQRLYQAILDAMTYSISLLEKLPWASLSGPGWFDWELGLWYAFILCLAIAWVGRRTRFLWLGGILFVLGELTLTVMEIARYRAAEMVVFDVPNGSLYGIRSGNRAMLLLDSNHARSLSFQTQGWLARLPGPDTVRLGRQWDAVPGVSINPCLLGLGGSVVCLVRNNWQQLPHADWYVVSAPGLAAPLEGLHPGRLVFDGSVDPTRVLATHPGLAGAHFVRQDGAWVAGFD